MSLSFAEIENLARLCRLSLSKEEQTQIQHNLNTIINYIENLKKVDVSHTEPMTHANLANLPLRKDIAVTEPTGCQGLTGSAGYEEGLIRVPAIIE